MLLVELWEPNPVPVINVDGLMGFFCRIKSLLMQCQ
jgi:hypothetical protein